MKMNPSTVCSLCVIVVVSMLISTGDSGLIPGLPDPVGIICSVFDCGHGTCTAASNATTSVFPVACDCSPGWKNVQMGNLTIYPACILPNCTINFGCGNGSPAPTLPPVVPPSPTDPCVLSWCGEGTCVVVDSGRQCQCNAGADNIMGDKSLPCLEECALGGDCSGVSFGNAPPPPTNSASSKPGLGGVKSSSVTQHSLSLSLLAAIFISMF